MTPRRELAARHDRRGDAWWDDHEDPLCRCDRCDWEAVNVEKLAERRSVEHDGDIIGGDSFEDNFFGARR